MKQDELYLGILSGTSLDALDIVLVAIAADGSLRHQAAMNWPLPQPLRKLCHQLCTPGTNELVRYGTADRLFAQTAAEGVLHLLKQENVDTDAVTAIGSHGQTVRHHPDLSPGFTLQLGCPHTLAALTKIDVIAQFRQKDIAFGGQGAPLAPAFHDKVFRSPQRNRVIVNIGGITNLTLLPADPDGTVIGFDSGPGNTLMDDWIYRHHQHHYDVNGHWAASGEVHPQLLQLLLSDPYFAKAAPKSTGREYFTPQWLHRALEHFSAIPPADVQATLAELTAQSLCSAIATTAKQHQLKLDEVYVCGGGVHNQHLLNRCAALLPTSQWQSTASLGVDPDWVEGALFAWLAWCHCHKKAPDLSKVTGAAKVSILGAHFPGR